MAEFKIKPVPAILLTVLLLGAVYHAWYFNFKDEKALAESDSGTTESKQHPPEMADTATAVRQDILSFFKVPMDGIKVTWAHATNSKAKLDMALKDDAVMMIEADVQLRDTDNESVMAHDTEDITPSTISLKEWLQKVSNNEGKGIKLDIKKTSALAPSLKILEELKAQLHGPIWINADILKGPNAAVVSTVDAKTFFKLTSERFSRSTLSVGWTTGYKDKEKNEFYSKAMVEEMYDYCKNSTNLLNFPVRASLTAESIPHFQWLIDKLKRSSLTVWHSEKEEKETVSIQDLVTIRKSFGVHRVFYDLPEKMMEEFSKAVTDQQR